MNEDRILYNYDLFFLHLFFFRLVVKHIFDLQLSGSIVNFFIYIIKPNTN